MSRIDDAIRGQERSEERSASRPITSIRKKCLKCGRITNARVLADGRLQCRHCKFPTRSRAQATALRKANQKRLLGTAGTKS
jgi:hypothetical protein